MSGWILAATAALSLAGWPMSDDAPGQKGRPVEGSQTNAPAGFRLSGGRSGVQTERFALVRDEKALKALLKQHNPTAEPNAKPVDFARKTVVAYFAGSRPTGGYSVELIGVERKKRSAVVRFRLWKPGPGMMVTQAFTSPFHIEAVDRLPARVTHTVTVVERAFR